MKNEDVNMLHVMHKGLKFFLKNSATYKLHYRPINNS